MPTSKMLQNRLNNALSRWFEARGLSPDLAEQIVRRLPALVKRRMITELYLLDHEHGGGMDADHER